MNLADVPPPLDALPEAINARILGDAVRLAMEPLPEAEKKAKPQRFTVLSPSDVRKRPRLRWAVRKVVPLSGLLALYGASGSGKTFLSFDLAAAMAEGGSWFGYRIRESYSVLVVALEGQEGVRQRIEAWEINHGRPFPHGVRFVFDSFKLTDPEDVFMLAAVIEDAGGADVVMIDTLNRAAPDMDENSSRDMGMAIEGCKQLQALTGGLVGLIAHTGKDTAKGLRGHSSLFAALDAAIEVIRNDAHREWRVAKSKDGEDGKSHPFRLEVVEVGQDEEGEPITSCAVATDLCEPAEARPRLPKGGNQRVIYDALGPLFRESVAFGKAGAPPQRPCLDLDEAIRLTRDRLTVETARKTERTRQAFTGLVSTGVLGCNEGWIWLR